MNTTPCIFNDNERVIQQEQVAMKGFALPFNQWNKSNPFYAINPVKLYGDNRKAENVLTMKNFLFESDTLTIDQQKELLKERLDIISMATYSGNKSIHFIIQITDIPTTIDEYKHIWNLLKNKYFPCADTQCIVNQFKYLEARSNDR